jgi:hypothetical protein
MIIGTETDGSVNEKPKYKNRYLKLRYARDKIKASPDNRGEKNICFDLEFTP